MSEISQAGPQEAILCTVDLLLVSGQARACWEYACTWYIRRPAALLKRLASILCRVPGPEPDGQNRPSSSDGGVAVSAAEDNHGRNNDLFEDCAVSRELEPRYRDVDHER